MPIKSSTDAYKAQAKLPKLVANQADLDGFHALKGENWEKAKARAIKKQPKAPDLEPEEISAIEGYTSQDFGYLNPMLRNGGAKEVPSLVKGKKYQPADLLPYLNCIVSGMNKLPAAKLKTVYRGTNLPKAVLDNYTVDAVVSDKAFLSTTGDTAIAYAPMSGKASLHRFTIHHTSGKDVTALTLHPNETEILFLPGTAFKINARSEPDKSGIITIEMTEV